MLRVAEGVTGCWFAEEKQGLWGCAGASVV